MRYNDLCFSELSIFEIININGILSTKKELRLANSPSHNICHFSAKLNELRSMTITINNEMHIEGKATEVCIQGVACKEELI
jgi:hypothetical protein